MKTIFMDVLFAEKVSLLKRSVKKIHHSLKMAIEHAIYDYHLLERSLCCTLQFVHVSLYCYLETNFLISILQVMSGIKHVSSCKVVAVNDAGRLCLFNVLALYFSLYRLSRSSDFGFDGKLLVPTTSVFIVFVHLLAFSLILYTYLSYFAIGALCNPESNLLIR